MKNNSIGYLKYEAEYIQDGIFDARKSAQALLGFDEMMKYFIRKEAPELSSIDFSLPVKITEGSWEALIPENINDLVKLGCGTLLSTYLFTTVQKAAKDGFTETGMVKDIKKLFKTALYLIQWCIKIKKHLKGKKIMEGLDKNTDSVILDVDGVKLLVPLYIYLIYQQLPERIFSKASSVIDDDTEMVVGLKDDNKNEFIEEKISIDNRYLFHCEKEDSLEILFPEMIDGERVEITGEITRNNDKTNTIGFEYNGHILTCAPDNKASLTKYKNKIISKSESKFFTTAKIIGIVDRTESNGLRPKIRFTEIIPIESQIISQQELF